MTTRALDTANENPEQSGSWSGVLAIAVCAFALVASEFLPVSLLTPIANDLGTTEGMAGQGIAISGAFAVLTSLFISSVAGSLNRKTLLLGLTAAMGMSGAIVALAPNYFVYMLGRALIGIVIGGFWSMSAATAMRLVPANDVPRALALVNGGNALATKEISPRPILFIHGERAHSRYFSETAYAAAAEPKELLIVPGASHVDLYDRLDRIPFDRIAGFFDEHL